MKVGQSFPRHATPVALVLLAQVASAAYIGLTFEFPVNDDAVYIEPVRALMRDGVLGLPDATGVTLIGQVLYGAAWCVPFGFSIAALHCSTVAAWLALTLASYWLLREVELEPSWALAGAFLVALNPVVTCLSMSFMTDIPCLLASTLALAAYTRALKTGRNSWAYVGAAFATWAILIRQIAVLVSAAFLIVWLVQFSSKRRKPFSIASLLVPMAVLGCFLAWLYGVRGPTLQWGAVRPALPWQMLSQVPFRVFTVLIHVGLFVAPLSLAAVVTTPKRWFKPSAYEKMFIFVAAALLAMIVGAYAIWRVRLPYFGNTMNGPGLGPYTLRDIGILGYAHPLSLPFWVWPLLILASWVGASWIVASLFQQVRAFQAGNRSAWITASSQAAAPMLICAALHLLVFCLLNSIYDRYLTSLILPAIVVGWFSRDGLSPSLPLAGALIAIVALAGVLGTRTYVAWNSARWKLLDRLVHERSVPLDKIDGGLEFGWLHQYELNKHAPPSLPGASNPWVTDDEYVVTFAEIDGHHVIDTEPFSSFLVSSRVLALRRDEMPASKESRADHRER